MEEPAGDKDIEIARLQGQLEEARRAKGGGGGVLKALGVLVLIGVGMFGCVIVVGSMLPDGQRFERACKMHAPPTAVRQCMADLQATYRGPDEGRYKQNAAAMWAADRGY